MPLSWNEIKSRAIQFSKEWEHDTSEDAEAKSFWDDFFNVFGIHRRRVATFEKTSIFLKTGNMETGSRVAFTFRIITEESGKYLVSCLNLPDFIVPCKEITRCMDHCRTHLDFCLRSKNIVLSMNIHVQILLTMAGIFNLYIV